MKAICCSGYTEHHKTMCLTILTFITVSSVIVLLEVDAEVPKMDVALAVHMCGCVRAIPLWCVHFNGMLTLH